MPKLCFLFISPLNFRLKSEKLMKTKKKNYFFQNQINVLKISVSKEKFDMLLGIQNKEKILFF